MELLPFSLAHKGILQQYLRRSPHLLCGYAFENIYVWRCLFDIQIALLKDNLCLFFSQEGGCFMPLPPLGGLDEKTVQACFDRMDSFNHNRDFSRIENIEGEGLTFFKKSGFKTFEKSKDYIVGRAAIASLASQKYKSKRALYNYFVKNYRYHFRDYSPIDEICVVALYERWARQRGEKNKDGVYRMLLADSAKVLKRLLEDYAHLNMKAKVIEADGEICAFTCGFPLNKDIFCVNYEFTDPRYKGISQFIFSAFARCLEGYALINMMDDSDIDNVRWTKESFHPVCSPVSYTALKGQ